MRRAVLALLGVGAVVLVIVRVASRTPGTQTGGSPPPTADVEVPAEPEAPPGAAALRRLRPMRARGAKRVMRSALDRYVAQKGLDLPEYTRRRLVAALASLRRYARRVRRAPYARAVLQARLDRVTAETDRLFREKLGVGVREFMAQALPGEIADVGAPHPATIPR